MMTEKPKFKTVVVQIGEYKQNKYVKGSNHRITILDASHDKVYEIVNKAILEAVKKNK